MKYQKTQSIKLTKRVSNSRKTQTTELGDLFAFFNIHCCKTKKLKGDFLVNFVSKKSPTMPKKLKGGILWNFSTSILSQNIKKLKGGPFGEFFSREKLPQCQIKLKGGTRLSSVGQMFQFGTIKICRTFKNYFGQFGWIEKNIM